MFDTPTNTLTNDGNNIKIHGYLTKQSRWIGRNSKRYCVLMNGAIYTYRSITTHQIQTLTFDPAQANETFNLAADYRYLKTKPNQHQFIICNSPTKTDARTFTADSKDEFNQWVICIKKAQRNNEADLSSETIQLILDCSDKLFAELKQNNTCHEFNENKKDSNHTLKKTWHCKRCIYNNRIIMVGGEWKFSEVKCGFCGNLRNKNTQIPKNNTCPTNNERCCVSRLHICNNEQILKWKQIKKNQIYDDIKCDVSCDTNLNKFYFEICDVDKVIYILNEVINDLNDDELCKIKEDIIKYILKHNINGRKLLEIGRKGFVKQISKLIGYNKLNRKIGKCFSRMKTYHIDCKALQRICFVLQQFELMDERETNIKEFIKYLYINPAELLEDMTHILQHKEILNTQPYIKCVDEKCKHYKRISTGKQHDIDYIGYLDCVHSVILHNKMDEIRDIMDDFALSIRKYAKYSVYSTNDFIDYKNVSPLYDNLKEELTSIKNEDFRVCKTDFYETLKSAQAIIYSIRESTDYATKLRWTATKAKKQDRKAYGIEYFDLIPIECLLSIKLYCEHSGLRRQLRESTNERFYWLKRNLYIATTFYGSALNVSDYLFHGLPQKYLFDKFSTILNSPTSTTTNLNVAAQYAGDYGAILKFSMKFDNKINLSRYLETESICNYDGEERIFYGSEVLAIIDIIIYNGNKWISNSQWINSILYFERIIEQDKECNYIHGRIDKLHQKRYLLPLIVHQIHRNSAYKNNEYSKCSMKQQIPEYILTLFEHFCDSKRNSINLSLIMDEINDMSDDLQKILFTNINKHPQINEQFIKLIFPNLKKYKHPNGELILLEDECSSNHSISSLQSDTKLMSELNQMIFEWHEHIAEIDDTCSLKINPNDLQSYTNNNTPVSTGCTNTPTTVHENGENENDIKNDIPRVDDDYSNVFSYPPIPPIPVSNGHALNVNATNFVPETTPVPQHSVRSFASVCTLEPIEEHENESDYKTPKAKTKRRLHGKPQYHPPNRYRGQGNVQISKSFSSKKMPLIIAEKYNNLYDFMDKSLSIEGCEIKFECEQSMFVVINYGFHDRQSREILYCIAQKQDLAVKRNRNYSWKMIEELYTANEIAHKYGIYKLPISLASQNGFAENMMLKETIEKLLRDNIKKTKQIIKKTKWQNVTIFKRKNNVDRRTQFIEKNKFISDFSKFFMNNKDEINLIPILMFDDHNAHWFEYVWIVRIAEDIDIGISFKYDTKLANKIKVNGIHLDKKYLLLQHQLVPWKHDCCCLNTFISSIDYYHIGNPDDHLNQNKNLQKQMKILQKKNEELKKQLITDKGELNGQINTLNNDVASLQSVIIGLKQQLVTQMNIVSSTQMLLTPQVNNYVISIPPYIQQNMKFNMHQNMKQNQ